MEHIGLDLGGRESQVCVRNAAGEIIAEMRVPTRGVGAYLRGRPPSRVVLETCAESFAIADAAAQAGGTKTAGLADALRAAEKALAAG